jgi:hypothetical protein
MMESMPITPATRSGKKYVRSSLGSTEMKGSRNPPTIITAGASTSRGLTTKAATKEPPTSPKSQLKWKDHGNLVVFGDLKAESCFLTPGALLRLVELLALQRTHKIHPHDVVLERQLLADLADDLALSRAISSTYKGGSKPREEDLALDSDEMMGTLYWRTLSSGGGYLAQSMEVTDKELHGHSFMWMMPAITVWPPPLVMGPDAVDNTLWDFELKNRDAERAGLHSLATWLSDQHCGAFFVKVCTCLTTLTEELTNVMMFPLPRYGCDCLVKYKHH